MTWEQIALRLGVALLLGGAIGLGQQWRSRYVGLRTNTLITIGSAALMIFGLMLSDADPTGLSRIASQTITGIGFLCAGVVAVGMFAGTGLFAPAAILITFIILVNLFFRPLVYFINRTTVPEKAASYGDNGQK